MTFMTPYSHRGVVLRVWLARKINGSESAIRFISNENVALRDGFSTRSYARIPFTTFPNTSVSR